MIFPALCPLKQVGEMNMKPKNSVYRPTLFEKTLLLFLILQFILIAFCNLTLIDSSLDCDNSQLYRHVVEMWRHKTLDVPGWKYSTTLEYDCVALFALPIYGITKDIFLSCGLSNIILTGIFIACVFFLFSGKKLLYPLLAANLICIPYGMSMLGYFNMMFFSGTWYNIKVLLPILLVGVLLSTERQQKTKLDKNASLCFTYVYIFLLALNCISSGSYTTLCGLIPVFLMYFGYKFFKWEKVPRSAIIISGISLFCIVGGIALNAHLGGTRTSGMEITPLTALLANISNCFFALFELFGGVTESKEVAVLSYEGIVVVSRIFFVLGLLVCFFVAMARCIHKKADLRLLMLVAIFVWNYIILNIVDTRAGSATTEYRYHLMGAIPLMCIACIIVADGLLQLKPFQQKSLFWGGFAAVVFLCISAYLNVFAYEEKNREQKELMELTEYCSTLDDVYHVYMYYGSYDSDICRILDLEKQYLYTDETSTTQVYNYYDCYTDGAVQPLNSIVVVNNHEFDFGDSFTIHNYRLKKFHEVANRSLYYFDL